MDSFNGIVSEKIMAAAGDVWLSSAAVFMWQRNAAGYDTKTFREDRHGAEENFVAEATAAGGEARERASFS